MKPGSVNSVVVAWRVQPMATFQNFPLQEVVAQVSDDVRGPFAPGRTAIVDDDVA